MRGLEMAEDNNSSEHWLTSKWRPAMGWMYMVVCTMDMVVFPIIWSIAQVITKQPITQWDPLTLRGAGLFHMAMGAVLGIAAFGRTQEKVAGASVVTTPSPTPTPTPSVPYTDPTPSVSAPIQPQPVATDPVVNTTPSVPDPTDTPPVSSKMAERMARFKKA
jgi:hypothetical protein